MKKILLVLRFCLFSLSAFAPNQPLSIYYYSIIPPEEVMAPIRAKYLRESIELCVAHPCYQARKVFGKWWTYCNIAVRDLIDGRLWTWGRGYGFMDSGITCDPSPVFPRAVDILITRIPRAWDLADRAWRSGKINKLNPYEAQCAANRGRRVWVISKVWNHEAIVCPDDSEFSEERGPLIGQAGGEGCNGIMYITDPRAFGWRYDKGGIRFYEFR